MLILRFSIREPIVTDTGRASSSRAAGLGPAEGRLASCARVAAAARCLALALPKVGITPGGDDDDDEDDGGGGSRIGGAVDAKILA